MSASSSSCSYSSSHPSSSALVRVVAGTWKRLFEEEPIGNTPGADTTTLVLWTQARDSGIYVDIRLPLNSPGRYSSSCLDNDTAAAKSKSSGIVIQPRPSALAATGFSEHAKTQLKDDCFLDILLQQKSFAGVITVQAGDTTETTGLALKRDAVLADLVQKSSSSSSSSSCSSSMTIPLCTCFWRRDLDYQPPTLDLDIGVCISADPAATAAAAAAAAVATHDDNNDNGSIVMRETGANGTYAEGWQRLPHTAMGPFMALELQSENDLMMAGARKGYWVRAGRCFAYAVGRPTSAEFAKQLSCVEHCDSIQNDCIGKTLAEAVEHLLSATTRNNISGTTGKDKIMDLLGSYVGLAGEIDDSNGKWLIQHSTNPELVGCLLVGGGGGGKDDVALCCSQLRLTPTGGEGDESNEVEQIIFRDGAPLVKRRWKVIELSGCSLPTS